MKRRRRAAIILAAGKGVRMRSSLPKALCEVSGRPMVEMVIDIVRGCGIDDIVVIGGYKIELLKKRLAAHKVKIIRQSRLMGSADAVKRARGYFKGFSGTVVVMYADTPLIKVSTLKGMLNRHLAAKAAVTVLTGMTSDPKEYGRIARDGRSNICGIVEHTDIVAGPVGAAPENREEINIGAYCFDAKALFEGIVHIKKNQKKGEFYLTDIISYFYNNDNAISSFTTDDDDEMLGINTREDLLLAHEALRKRTIIDLSESGVDIKDPSSVYIKQGARIGPGTVIYPFVVIDRDVIVGRDCGIGPFAHLRKGTVLDDGSQIGNFVEVVRSRLGKGSRAKHHTYLGDTVIGSNVNVGAGSITANYNGKSKNQTIIGNGAFIGSGTTIVAPVKIGKGAMTGAGSVVVKGRDVPANTTVVGVPARPIKRDVDVYRRR